MFRRNARFVKRALGNFAKDVRFGEFFEPIKTGLAAKHKVALKKEHWQGQRAAVSADATRGIPPESGQGNFHARRRFVAR
jgi:hypothetical protein